MNRAGWLVAVVAGAIPFAASAGLVIDVEQANGPVQYSLSGKKLRIETKGQRHQVTIFDGDAQRLYELDPEKKQYREMTQADAQAAAQQLQSAMSKMPPEQRAKIEEQQKQMQEQAGKVEYERTGKKDKVAGLACERYLVKREGKATDEGCFIPWGKGVKKEDFASLTELGKFMDAYVATAFGKARAGGGGVGIAEKIDRAPGFPALLDRVSDGKRQTQERLVSLKQASIPTATFQVPAGYTQAQRPTAPGGHGPGSPPMKKP